VPVQMVDATPSGRKLLSKVVFMKTWEGIERSNSHGT